MIDREAFEKAWLFYWNQPTDMCADYEEEQKRLFENGVRAYLTSAGEGAVPVGWTASAQLELVGLGVTGIIRKDADEFCTVPLYAAPHPPRQDGAREVDVDDALDKLGRAIMALPPDLRSTNPAEGIKKLRAMLTTPPAPDEAVEAEREALCKLLYQRLPPEYCDPIIAEVRARRDGGGGV